MLDLTPYLARRPKELSGGQRQRVAMGRAIVRHPQVFLMDEPLSNLDAKLRVQMRADIAKLQHDLGTTTIYVTHDQVEAMTMGDRVAVMSLGLLQQVDTPQRLYETPANLFVAGFIGTPPMNLIQADVSTQNGTVSVTLAGQRVELSDAVLKRYPGTRGYDGRSVVSRRAQRGSVPGGGAPGSPDDPRARCSCSRRSARTRWRTSRSTLRPFVRARAASSTRPRPRVTQRA